MTWTNENIHRHFFKSLFTLKALKSEGTELCAGDFNVVLHHKIDTTSLKMRNTHLTKIINAV